MDFVDRVAVVTGGTGALGSAVALDLLQSGARVAVTYTSVAEWRSLSERAARYHERLDGLRVDLTTPSAVDSAFGGLKKRCGRVDILVAAAGGFAAGKSYETDDATWDGMLNVNLKTLVNALRAIVPGMLAQNFGRVVTVSSGAIANSPGAGIAAYAVSKAAVNQLSRVVAEEVKGHGISVHCVMPGTMDTPANRKAMLDADFSKWVTTEKVAGVIHRLLLAGVGDAGPMEVPVLD
jgi:NAD(P)-dependent dehydrogenase (short-subunit alcohol dehydrogenase family)